MPPVDTLTGESRLATKTVLNETFTMRENTNLLGIIGSEVSIGTFVIKVLCDFITVT